MNKADKENFNGIFMPNATRQLIAINRNIIMTK